VSSPSTEETDRIVEKTPPPQSAIAEPPPRRRGLIGSFFGGIFQFAAFLITLPLLPFRRRRTNLESVTVYAAHPSFSLWALILVGFVFAAIVNRSPDAAGALGWAYVLLLLYFMLTLLYDFSPRKLGLWMLIFAAVWLLAKYVEYNKEIAIVSYISDYLASLHPKLDPGSVTVLSWLLLLPWLGSIAHMVLNGRKKFTPNEIGEFHFAEGSELTDRTGLRFRTKYRDVLETILTFGGGDLLAVDNHQHVIKRWDNVIGLFFLWKDLDRVLHTRVVMETNDDEEDTNPKR
jgi:hypothetical protein